MADDRYRRTGSTNATPASPGARRSPISPAAPRQPGPDPLVELARLIGQNETASYEPARPAARQRRAAEIAEQNAPAADEPASYAPPYARAPERSADRLRDAVRARGADQERYSDQRRDGYAAPTPAAAPPIRRRAERAEPAASSPEPPSRRQPQPQARTGEPVERAPSQPAEPAWRPPRTKARTPPPAAYPGEDEDYASAHQDDRKPLGERVAPRAPEPVLPRGSEGRRAPAPPREDYSDYERAGVEAAAPRDYRDYYDEPGPAPAEAGGEPAYDDYDYGGRDYDASYQPGRRKLWLAVALLVLAVVGTAGAYGLRAMLGGPSGGEATAPPVIKADSSPKKIAASQSGDKQIQDRLGDRGAGERLVPREEQPVTIKDPGASALPPVGRPAEPPPVVTAPATTAATVVRPPGSQPAPAAPAAEPKRIKTVTIRPEGQQDDAAPPPSASSARTTAPAPAAPSAPPRAVRPATPVAPGGEPMSIAPQAAPAPAPAPRSQTALAAPPPRTSTGDYVVQLSAQKSESDAQASFRAMQAKYPSVLSGRQPLIRRKDLGAKGVYFGAQVGPFASQSEAAQLCEQLKAAGGTCIVQRN